MTFAFYKHNGHEEYTNIGRTLCEIIRIFDEYLYDNGTSIVDGVGHVCIEEYKPGMETGKLEFDVNDVYRIIKEEDLNEDEWYMLKKAYYSGKFMYPEQYDAVKRHITMEEEE